LKDNSLGDEDIRTLIDWKYYLERFGSVIQKLITIPAAAQEIENPVPRIKHPDWLLKRLATVNNKEKQMKITDMFMAAPPKVSGASDDEKENRKEPVLKDIEEIVQPKAERMLNGKRRLGTKLILPRGWKRNKSVIKNKTVDTNPFSIKTEYLSWLEYQKPIWAAKLALKSKSIRRKEPKEGIAKFFDTNISIGNYNWTLLSLQETDSSGIFRMFIIVNGRMESIDVDVPRILYLNSRVLDENSSKRPGVKMIKRTRTLPRGHPCLNLYELQMTEYFYRMNSVLFSSMFNHKDIEGVYESNVPLLFRALISLGTFGKLAIPVDDFDRTKPLDLSSISRGNLTNIDYLKKNSFQVIYVYHSHSLGNHFVSIFIPSTGKLYIQIVNKFNNQDQLGPIKKLYQDQFQEQKDQGFFEYPVDIELKTVLHKTEREMFQSLNEVLLGVGKTVPMVIMLQSSNSLKYYRNNHVSAFREFPHIQVPWHKSDNDFPALGWQRYSVTRMLNHVFNLSEFLNERISLARYADVIKY
jgi:DNA polymerase epsilon subunit 1